MALYDHELARLEDGRLRLRNSPLRVRWYLNDLMTSDGHTLRLTFSCSVQALEDDAEQQMLGEVFLGKKPTVTQDDVVSHFAPALRAAAAKAAAGRVAAQWLGETTQEQDEKEAAQARAEGTAEATQSLQAAAKKVAFSCGIEVLAPFSIELESPSFQQQKIEAMERTLSERRAAGQVEHFQRAAELLRQFQAMRESTPSLTPSAVLDQLSPSDRGMMLQTLLLAAAKQNAQQALWAVSGPCLVKIDAKATPPAIELHPLPPTVGPLRSVQPAEVDGKAVLLVGARSGVMIVRPESLNDVQIYADQPTSSELGFNRAIVWHNGLWACHGDAGIVSWELGQTSKPVFALRPAELTGLTPPPIPESSPPIMPPPVPGASIQSARMQNVRNLNVLDETRLILSMGQRLLTVDREGKVVPMELEPRSEIVAIVPDNRRIFVIHENGVICTRDRSTLESLGQDERGMRVTTVGVLPWLGSIRLLLAGEDGPIQCVGFDDQLVTQYASPHRSVRQVTGAVDLVAAVSADRQRLILWNSWDGRRPIADISIAAASKHRIADIDFG